MHRQREEDCASIEHTESAINSAQCSVSGLFLCLLPIVGFLGICISICRILGNHWPLSVSQSASQSVCAPIVKPWPLFFKAGSADWPQVSVCCCCCCNLLWNNTAGHMLLLLLLQPIAPNEQKSGRRDYLRHGSSRICCVVVKRELLLHVKTKRFSACNRGCWLAQCKRRLTGPSFLISNLLFSSVIGPKWSVVFIIEIREWKRERRFLLPLIANDPNIPVRRKVCRSSGQFWKDRILCCFWIYVFNLSTFLFFLSSSQKLCAFCGSHIKLRGMYFFFLLSCSFPFFQKKRATSDRN